MTVAVQRKPPLCRVCKQPRTPKEFGTFRDKNRAAPQRQTTCADCRREEKYGLSRADFDAFLKKQRGKCAICRKARALDVDHCHVTGVVRGLLCRGCNVGLGMLGDNAAGLRRAIKYLEG